MDWEQKKTLLYIISYFSVFFQIFYCYTMYRKLIKKEHVKAKEYLWVSSFCLIYILAFYFTDKYFYYLFRPSGVAHLVLMFLVPILVAALSKVGGFVSEDKGIFKIYLVFVTPCVVNIIALLFLDFFMTLSAPLNRQTLLFTGTFLTLISTLTTLMFNMNESN